MRQMKTKKVFKYSSLFAGYFPDQKCLCKYDFNVLSEMKVRKPMEDSEKGNLAFG